MPTIAPLAKQEKCRALGATVVLAGTHLAEARAVAVTMRLHGEGPARTWPRHEQTWLHGGHMEKCTWPRRERYWTAPPRARAVPDEKVAFVRRRRRARASSRLSRAAIECDAPRR